MKVKLNKHIIFSISLIIIIVITVLFLSLVQSSSFDKESVEEIDTTDIPISAGRIIYMRIGETKTFDHVFCVYSNRWVKEGLDWEVYEISFDPGIIVSCSPNSGIIYPGDPPTVISLTVALIGKDINTDTYTGRIGVRRVSDLYDKVTVDITIVVVNRGG